MTNTNWEKTATVATLIAAIATCVIALSNYRQIHIMEGSLQVLQESLRISNQPRLLLSLDSKGDSAHVELDKSSEGDRWNLWYYIINKSDNPACNIMYAHSMDNSESFTPPSEDKLADRYEDLTLYPGSFVNCGFDPAYRRAIADGVGAGKNYFRHLYVEYEDESGNRYAYAATWKMEVDAKSNSFLFTPLINTRIE